MPFRLGAEKNKGVTFQKQEGTGANSTFYRNIRERGEVFSSLHQLKEQEGGALTQCKDLKKEEAEVR